MHVEIRYQFFGSGGGTEGQGSWPFQMEKSALELLTNRNWGFQGPTSNGDPTAERYVLRKGGALLLSVALEQPARYEHEVLQRIVGLLKTDNHNNKDWELVAFIEDDSHIDALQNITVESLEDSFSDVLDTTEEDPVDAERSPYDFCLDEWEIEDLLDVLEEHEIVLDEVAIDVVIEVNYDG
jgi:hypothetical protein